jgi:YVTN family beta-propeller protein
MKEIACESVRKGYFVIVLGVIALVTYYAVVVLQGASPFAYIANYGDNTVSVIDIATSTVIATVPVGLSPYGVAVSPDGTKVYVANQDSNNISIINTTSNTVTSTVGVGAYPCMVAVSPDGSKIYVANNFDDTVSIINTSTNNVTDTVSVGSRPNRGCSHT